MEARSLSHADWMSHHESLLCVIHLSANQRAAWKELKKIIEFLQLRIFKSMRENYGWLPHSGSSRIFATDEKLKDIFRYFESTDIWFYEFLFFIRKKRHHARNLLRNKYILFIGDSVQGGANKDLVAFLQDGTLMSDEWVFGLF